MNVTAVLAIKMQPVRIQRAVLRVCALTTLKVMGLTVLGSVSTDFSYSHMTFLVAVSNQFTDHVHCLFSAHINPLQYVMMET